jgi:catechol 2,3-dioxygenase-like lactoylglutathione lyase family enzyme
LIQGLRHTGIVVSDLDEAMTFYVETLGFSVIRRMEEGGDYLAEILGIPDVHATTIKMSAPDGGMIELLHFPDHQGTKHDIDLITFGPTHIALTVPDLDLLYCRLNRQGILFRSSPRTSPDGKVRIAFCQAPDGTWLELVEELS